MYNPESMVEELWRETAAVLAQEPEPEGREQAREEYVRRAVRELESPERGGYVVEDLSGITGPTDEVERQYIKRAFKRLVKRGELVKVEPIGEGMLYRLV